MNMRDTICRAKTSGPTTQPDGAVEFQFCFPAEEPVFAGHFPKRPILPGVFQLEMSRLAAEWTLKSPITLSEVSKAKFLRPIAPGDPVRLLLKCSETAGQFLVRSTCFVRGQPAGESQLRLCRSA